MSNLGQPAVALVYLLTVAWGGRTWRWATSGVDVDSDDGILTYRSGLTLDAIEESADPLSDAEAWRSVGMEIPWDGVVELVAAGEDLGAATGELAVLAEGDTWEERLPLVVGFLSDPAYDETGIVTTSLVDDRGDDSGTLLDEAAIVTEGLTWADPDSTAGGVAYPFVFGAPGVYMDLATQRLTTCPGSPAPVINVFPGRALVGGHTCAASTLTLIHPDDNTVDLAVVIDREADDEGRPTTVATMPSAVVEGTEYFAAWEDGEAYPGSGRAGELLRILLSRSTVAIDLERLAGAIDWLNRWEVDGYCDEQCAPLDWVRQNLLPILPVSLVPGPTGLYPVVWQWDATDAATIAELDVGRDCASIGVPRVEGRDAVATEIALTFAIDANTGRHLRTLTCTGEGRREGEAGVMLTEHSRSAWSRYGRRRLELDTDVLYRDSSAALTLSWLSWLRAGPRVVREVDLSRRRQFLRPGDRVRLNDSAYGLADRRAWVRRLRWAGASLSAELVLLEV